MYPHIKLERGETAIKTQFNGGYKWHVHTEFPVDEATFKMSLMMATCGDDLAIHLHHAYLKPGPLGRYDVSHQYVVNPFGAGSEYEERV